MASNKLWRSIALNVLLALGAVVVLLPFVWMLSLSVKPENEIYTPTIHFLPHAWDWANYAEAFEFGEVGTFIRNGIIVTGAILCIQLLTVIPCAYVLVIPLVLMIGRLGLLNTYTALIIPFMTSALGIFLIRQSLKAVPQDLIDAARVDGANETTILWTILVPQVKPAIAAFAVFSIVSHWNDFLWPLLVVNDMSLATPPLGVSIFASDEGGNDVGPMMASATMIVLPLLLIFLFARRWFIQGVTMSGLK